MASVVEEQLELNPAVAEFLSRQGAEAQFWKVARLVRECFPELVSLDAMLQADADEDGRVQTVLCARLPESLPVNRFQADLLRYHERLVAEVPLSHCPLFALVTDFVAE
jgi:hypothetical protein